MDVSIQRDYCNVGKFPKVAEWQQRIHNEEAYTSAPSRGLSYELVNFDMK